MRPEHSPPGFEHGQFKVVFICTGNRARSPFAAELLRRYARNLPVVVKSLGTLDTGPAPALPKALLAAEALGVDLASHQARSLTRGALAAADLTIGFEPFHVAAAIVTGEAKRERTFLLTELARLLDPFRMSWHPIMALRPADVVEQAHARRLESPVPTRSVADPVGSSRESFQATFERIGDLVTAIAVGILGDVMIAEESDAG